MKNREKRSTLAEFSLIWAFSDDHNVRRLRRYIKGMDDGDSPPKN